MENNKTKDVMIGLSYSMLNRGNYTTWALKMKVYMQAHGVWDAIDNESSKEVVEERIDRMALLAIYQGIPEDILLSIAEKKTTKEAWDAIKTMCLGVDRVKIAKIQTLKAEFEALSMKETEPFDDFSSAIEQFGNLGTMTVEEVVGSLKAHEERLHGQTEPSGRHLLLTKEEWSKPERDDGMLLLRREEWLKRSSTGGTDGSYRSRFRDCKKPKRERENKEAKEEEEDKVMLINEDKVVPKLKEKAETGQTHSNIWYLDNGASNHMTGDLSKLIELDKDVKGNVRFGDGSIMVIKGKGTISIKCKNGEERLLTDVYYIPMLCNNIISLGQLSEEGNKVILNGAYLWVYDKEK
ncbi:uncharacterized protein LOC141696557 [Apium graveolens]|uniref:uncharacterized protein LOC141696557 n=1 Tax=Apium graveolens TaxID=4045 RepID=UPI003D7B3909